MIHLMSSFKHYFRHLDPIWFALPKELQGDIIDARRAKLWKIPKDDVVLIAGAIDIDYEYGTRQIYVEHGAGQSYIDAPPKSQPYYHGGTHPSNVIGYVCPSHRVAKRWDRPTVVVGCPALDKHWASGMNRIPGRRTIAMTFHWDGVRICPEAGTALDHYIDDLPMIVQWAHDRNHNFIAHAHPRDKMAPGMWGRLGVEFVPDVDDVLSRASILIADNSSVLYEAAALGIRTIVLNAPWYRKDVHHGLRFWDAVPGPQVENADELVRMSPLSSDGFDRARREAAAVAYSRPAGANGAKLAADWIVQQATSLQPCH
jgi:hypothetical protein